MNKFLYIFNILLVEILTKIKNVVYNKYLTKFILQNTE